MKKWILLFLTILSVLATAGCSKDNGELTPTGYASEEVQRPQIMYNGRLYLYTAKGFDGPLPEGCEYVGEVSGVDNKHEPESDYWGSRVETGQKIYASKDSNVIYVEYESGYAEFAVSETEVGFDYRRMLSEDSKDVCGLYLKAGDPAYQLEVKPGGRLNRNQLTFTVNKSIKESVAREPIRHLELLSDFKNKDLKFYDTDSTSNDIYIEWNDTEYYTVMKEGGEADIVINELTGETAVMEAVDSTDYQYGDCRLYFDGEEEPDHFFISYEPYSGTYELWHNSADTLFKPVYEGNIYVFKGAQEEYINYFPLIPSDDRKGSPGVLRDISPEEGQDTPFCGNLPAFDNNGYLRGLYFAGD